MEKKVLFVDHDPNILTGLKRMLHPMRQEWDMEFTNSGENALMMMAQTPFDVIVSEMHMPSMNGSQLLSKVMNLYPHSVRILLSGESDLDKIMKSTKMTHQYLSKPCEPETLKLAVNRSCSLQNVLSNESLKNVLSQMESLPSLPSLYIEIQEEIESPNSSLQKIGQIISKDVGMTAKILQLVNSAFFGLPRHVSSPVHAVNYLGLDIIKALVLSVQIFSKFDQIKLKDFSVESLWEHSMTVGAFVKHISKVENIEKKMADNAYIAALLHDCGKLVLAAKLPEQYKSVIAKTKEGMILTDAELEVFNTTHAEVGAYLMGLWGLPNDIIEALAFHHHPSNCPIKTISPVTFVHVANALNYEQLNPDPEGKNFKIDSNYLSEVGITDKLGIWRDIYVEKMSITRP
jgi:HD-like signal output (HDOD) protein